MIAALGAGLACVDRPAGTAAESVARTPLGGAAPFAAMAQADLGALAGETPLSHMILLLRPSAAQSQALAELLAAQVDPSSPRFHHWLTPAEFGARFGVREDSLHAVTSWLTASGFTIDEVPAGRTTVVFSGTAAQLASAFGTELHRYQVGGEVRIANQSVPQVPTMLAPVIRGLVSLNDAPRAAAHRDVGTFRLDRAQGTVTPLVGGGSGPSSQFTTTIGTSTYQVVAPYDFATIYNLKPLWDQGIDGTGQRIAIVSRSDLDLADVERFRANFGLPPARVNKIYATANPGVTADVAETALDVQWSGAVAKGATIDLVIAGSSPTSDGVDLSALYIVNNNVAPVVSVSYGLCELGLGADGNAFYNTLWQQAAAQGQTVFVSSGDAGATTCNQGGAYSTLGLSVNGLGSTPYNVAVGGTDLYGTFTSPATYWSTTNDPTTLASALSYVPEIPWNDSCGNPVVLEVLRSRGFTDATTAELCNNSRVSTANYRNIVGGGGGVSNCLATRDGTVGTCTGGYAKPWWQAGPGVPAADARHLPDVSLFAGDGMWGSFYPYCVSSQTQSGLCDLTVSTNIQGAGGTSFGSPAFAGIMALVNQKTAAIHGNANPVFYKLAANQSALDCAVAGGTASERCVFHDVDLGGNATPCYNFGGAKDCTVSTAGNIWGVVTGYAATRGYDAAVGLGSVDITNLVNTWSTVTSALAATTTTLALDATMAIYGSGPAATVVVASSEGTPTGSFTVIGRGLSGRLDSDVQGTLSAGTGTLALALLPAGTYPVVAHYTGDDRFAASDSAEQMITVAKAATTLTVAPSRTDVTAAQSVLLALTIAASGSGAPPTGTVTVTHTATGAILGAYAVEPSALAVAQARVNVAGTQLIAGANTLRVDYSGDDNYAASTAEQALSFAAPFAMALSSDHLALDTAAAATSVSTTLTVSPASGALAYPITLDCVGALPAGASCALSTSVLDQPNTTATVTIGFDPALASHVIPRRGGAPVAAFAGLAGAVLLLGGRKRLRASLPALALLFTLPLVSCNGEDSPPSATRASISLTSSSSAIELGGSVTLASTLDVAGGSGRPAGSVSLLDSYRGGVRGLGTAAMENGAASLTVATLGLGTHAITAVFAGDGEYPAASSSAVSVSVSATSTIQIQATDANGHTVTAPLQVVLQ